ncbi:uncharacterized protein KIAA1755 homolog, partial [Pseudonaja textilis]|uniref:uncharacterized protein KIAA1755 homolog n=1 Tax=Pseudonaja textilis TaxID=8673 RepID=UPI000EA89030
DPQSLDAAVQNTLSGLFPPFEVTAPTVLSQLFRVLESKYHGDGLCCLLDFLIPLKRLLEHIRQAACAPYSGCVFLHEGWPLCLHEKVSVHLSPLNPLLLRPGDFYLQAEPCGEQSACLVVKCLSRDLTTVEKISIPDASCSWLFTEAWLEDINRDLERPTLRTCLVATGNGIVPVPWNKIATPEFVQLPKAEPPMEKDAVQPEPPNHPSGGDQASKPSQGKYPGLIKVDRGSWKRSNLFVVPSLCDIISENLEGEYVNLVEFSEEPPKVEMSSPSVAPHHLPPEAEKVLLQPNGKPGPLGVAWDCGKEQDLEEGPCTPCLRRKLSPDSKTHEPRCRYRDSYMAALQNPISFNSGLMAAILEEMDLNQAADTEVQPDEGSGQLISPNLSGHPNKDRKTEEIPRSGPTKPAKSPAEGPAVSSKFSFLKGHRPLASSGEGSAPPEKAGKGPEGPRKKTSMVSSPKVARVKPAAGKGSSQTEVAFGELSRPVNVDAVGVTSSSTDTSINEPLVPGSSPSASVPWDLLNSELLSSGIARLPGSVDKLGRPVVEIPQNGGGWQDPGISAKEVARLLLCLCSMARKRSHDQAVVILVDARKEAPPLTLPAALGSLQKTFPGAIQVLLLVAEKEAASQVEKFHGLQVETVTSPKALTRHVDNSQLTQAFDGHFPYNHREWVQFFQKAHHFVDGLKKASELLRTTTQELEKEEGLETLQVRRICWSPLDVGISFVDHGSFRSLVAFCLPQVHYNQGLSLSKEAAKIHGFKFPEMATFEAAKGAFQAKLTMFYMDMEMKEAELETFLDLYRFCDQVTAFHRDCKQHLARWQAREKDLNVVEVQKDTEDALRRMSEDFSEEKFQQVKLQASSMHSEKGRLIWSDALERSQEAKRILEDLLVSLEEAKGITAGDYGEKRSPSAPNSSSSIPVDVLTVDETLEATNNLEPFSKEATDRIDSSPKKPSDMDVRGHKEAPPGTILELGGLDHRDLAEEPSGRPQRASWDSSLLCRSSASSPKAEPMPGTRDTLPPLGHSCAPLLVRGPPRPQKRERAQYFQLSRHGSFSSEDADSQNSSEDAVDSSSTWSMELQGLRGGGAQEKGLGILYLENHSPSSGSGPVKPET